MLISGQHWLPFSRHKEGVCELWNCVVQTWLFFVYSSLFSAVAMPCKNIRVFKTEKRSLGFPSHFEKSVNKHPDHLFSFTFSVMIFSYGFLLINGCGGFCILYLLHPAVFDVLPFCRYQKYGKIMVNFLSFQEL